MREHVRYIAPGDDLVLVIDRLTDDDLVELLGTLGILRLEVQELRETAANMVPKDELGNRWRRMRLAGFIAAIAMLIVFIPFGILLNKASVTARAAKSGQAALIQDQYDRAIDGQRSCNQRNLSQVSVVGLVRALQHAEEDSVPSLGRTERLAAFKLALGGAGTLADCSAFTKQEQSLVAKGAKPHK